MTGSTEGRDRKACEFFATPLLSQLRLEAQKAQARFRGSVSATILSPPRSAIAAHLGSEHVFIAAARDLHARMTYRVFLLEQFSHSYRVIWRSQELYAWESNQNYFQTHDFDRDGVQELAFASCAFGTGGGSAALYLFVPALERQSELNIVFDWQDHLQPPQPVISLIPNDNDRANRPRFDALEKLGSELGFLENVRIPNLDDPSYASLRWHRDNGNLKSGRAIVHCYDGPPVLANSVEDLLDDEEVTWTSFFKGPVVGYMKEENKHFVVYCPSNIYNWPTCLCRAGRFLLIGTLGDGLIRYDHQTRCLEQIPVGNGQATAHDVMSIEWKNGYYEINGSIKISPEFVDS